MGEQKLVTVAIPFYNAEQFLDDAIRSVINQTHTNWELLLLDDGSTDGSLAIAQRYAAQDERITVYTDGENQGLVPRLNQSIEIAKGEYYARMDADDIMFVTRLEKEVEALEADPKADVVCSSFMTIDSENNILGSGFQKNGRSFFLHPTIMAAIDWFRQFTYDEWAVRAEDYELWCRTSANSKYIAVREPLLFYREFGVQSMKKLLQSYSTQRSIYRNFSNYHRPFHWYLIHSLSAWAKSVICLCYGLTGNIDKFVALRRRKPVPAAKCLTAEDLRRSVS